MNNTKVKGRKKISIQNRKITLGTKEWADSNVNCFFGCSNNCRYCYAKLMAIRFKRKTNDNWKIMEPNQKAFNKKYFKRKGRIMFPTSHDITNESLTTCLIVLKKLLSSKNIVLITTKPSYDCIKSICNKFENYKRNIQFRFTITSIDNKILKFWEPKAPPFEERLKSLKYAFNKSYKTSVSIEPILDNNLISLIKELNPYITESIWIGKMNYVKANKLNLNERKFYEQIRIINKRQNLSNIIEEVKKLNYKKIRIKDSIINFLSL